MGVLVVVFVKVEGGDCSLIVDADDSAPWGCGGEEGGDCLLDCVEFGDIHIGPTA